MPISHRTKSQEFEIAILRLGHRLVRDTRMSTHAALVGRALGASEIIMSGADEDDAMNSMKRVNERWGGHFAISQISNWREYIKGWDGIIVHLTMYGEHIDKALPIVRNKLRHLKKKKLLLIVGSKKVPREVYALSDYNIAIGSQPHSEVAALAVFLDRIYKGTELYSAFENAKIRIKPSARGKKVVNLN